NGCPKAATKDTVPRATDVRGWALNSACATSRKNASRVVTSPRNDRFVSKGSGVNWPSVKRVRPNAVPNQSVPSAPSASALSHLIRWIESFQFHAGVGGGEPPVDFREGLVSLFFPSGDLLRQERLAFKASVQALTREDTQLRLRHVQPTAVFGRVVALKPRRQGEGGRGIECFIQAGDAMRVEVVHHQHQDGGFRVDEQQ